MRLNLFKFIFLPIVVGALLFSISSISEAATFTWDGDGGDSNLSTAANWAGGTAPTGVSGDALVFTGSTGLTPNNDLSGATFTSITFSAGGFTLSGNAFTLDGGTAAISNTTGTNIISANITFSTAAPTIDVAASTAFTISGTIDNGGLTATTSVAGTLSLSGVISGTGGLIKSSTGTTTLSGANTFSGGLTIKQGGVVAGISNATTVSGAAGPSSSGITLGSTDGGSASLVANTLTISNPITLGSGAIGTLSIGNSTGAGAPTFSGAINLNGNDLMVAKAGTAAGLTISGGVTGTGNITFKNGGSSSIITISTNAVNNSGSVSVIGAGSGAVTLSGGIGSNVTGLSFTSDTIAVFTVGAIAVNSSGTTLTSNSASKAMTVSGGITGTGNLILKNNGSVAGGITISTTAVNHTGTITNSGTGSGGVSISAVISTNVTGVTQNSSTSSLTLSGANTFTGGVTVKLGTFVPEVSNATTESGAAGPSGIAITLGASDGGTASIIPASSVTVSNAINLASGAVGTLTIGASSTAAPTFSGAIALNGNNVVFAKSGTTGATIISGGVTGTGNITFDNSGSNSTFTVSTTAINNVGTITNTGSSSGTVTISAAVGSNVTGITENSATTALTVSGALTINSSGTTLTNSTAGGVLTVSGGITGTGNLVLNSNVTTSGAITISTNAVNHTGTITNSGSGVNSSGLVQGAIISAVIGSNVTTVTQNSTTNLGLSGANTFTGGLIIKKGNVVAGVSNATTVSGAAGPSGTAITLGASDGDSAGMLAGSFTVSNPINLGSGAIGTLTIGTVSGSPTFSGAIALGGNNLSVSNTLIGGSLIISGGITGTGNITFDDSNAQNLAITVSTNPINNAGTITNSTPTGSGGGTVAISGGVGSNVTGIIQNSTKSATTISGVLTVNGTSTTLTNSGGTKILTLSGGTTGTGNLILNNNSSLAAGITVSSTDLNHTGSITNSGSGTGSVTISASIGSNVTSVRYAASGGGTLLLSASNTLNEFRDDDGTIAHTIQFGAGTTQTVGTWDVVGASGAVVSLRSTTSGSPWTATSVTSGNQVSDYLSIQDSTAAGSSTWIAGVNSTDEGGNTGWSFTGIPSKLYFSVPPTSTAYGQTIDPVSVSVLDASDNLVSTAAHTITLSISSNPNFGTLSGTVSKAATAGIATFSDLSIDKAGNPYTLVASASGLTSATSDSFNITNTGQSGTGGSSGSSGGGGGGGGGGSSSYTAPAPAPAPAPASLPATQATLDSLIKQLQALQAQVAAQTPAPAPSAPSVVISQVSRPLTIGGRGTDVQSLQQFLINRSTGVAAQQLESVGATSYFGSLTRAALAEFQKSVGISPASGYFGPITKAYLKTIGY